MNKLLLKEDILNIPEEMLPMPVLSDNLRSFLSWGIKVHEQGCYNHFMWLYKPGIVATQNFLYTTEAIQNYFKKCRLKLWHNSTWTSTQRNIIKAGINYRLNKPWYKKRYDILAIVGQLFHLDWLQVPWLDICSDSGSLLKLVDNRYCLGHPDPEDVNRWLEAHKEYEVYGRYVPD